MEFGLVTSNKFAVLRSVLIALAICLCWTVPVFAGLSASDLLVVYNRNMPDSEKVASYYASRRNVPKVNLVGLNLPESEQISRSRYRAALFTPLRDRVFILKELGANPALLLVYGVPLRVGRIDEKVTVGLKTLGSERAAKTGALVLDLVSQLNRLGAGNEQSAPLRAMLDTVDSPTIIRHATEAINTMMASRKAASSPMFDSVTERKAVSILLSLIGITPLATSMAKLKQNDKTIPNWIRQQNNMLLRSSLLERGLATVPFQGVTLGTAPDIASKIRQSRGLIGELKFWHDVKQQPAKDKSSASVDSELSMLLAEPYSKTNWLPNPYLGQFDKVPGIDTLRRQTIMVARLDAPTPAIARRIVDDAIDVEKKGLDGIFYIDARGLDPRKKDSAYAKYDEQLRDLYRLVKEKSTLRVVLDDARELFRKGSCPDAALYCGWYSLGNYVDAFTWKKGAVGFHIASAEAKSLRPGGRNLWCKTMLEKGAVATLGPVAEPYLHSFPRPDLFFSLLMQGHLPLLEVYYRSIPNLSWRQVLIGDPLYTPFRNKPVFSE